MFDTETYLSILGYSTPPGATLEALCDLHKQHLIALPYDSSLNTGQDSSLWENVDIDADQVFDEIVRGGRGGVCYELNGLFRILLQKLGFEVEVLAAGIRQIDGSFGPELEHVFNYAVVDGEIYLVDVGFVGPSYLEPLHLTFGSQEQYGNSFKIVEEQGYRVVYRRGRIGDWAAVYRFHLKPRGFSEWSNPDSELADFARALARSGTLVRGRAFENGQRILIGRRYLTVDGGHDRIRAVIDPTDQDEVLSDILHRDPRYRGRRSTQSYE